MTLDYIQVSASRNPHVKTTYPEAGTGCDAGAGVVAAGAGVGAGVVGVEGAAG